MRANTGKDRIVLVSWIAIIMGSLLLLLVLGVIGYRMWELFSPEHFYQYEAPEE